MFGPMAEVRKRLERLRAKLRPRGCEGTVRRAPGGKSFRPVSAGLGSMLSLATLSMAFSGAGSALAAAPHIQIPTEEQLQPGAYLPSAEGPDFIAGLARTNYLLGNMAGLRPLLSQFGMSFAL